MSQIDVAKQIIAEYARHGWQLRRVLARPSSRAELHAADSFGDSEMIDAAIDALWFSRPSHAQREAWELRLVASRSAGWEIVWAGCGP